MRIGVMADDLTSAMDGAVPFARQGHAVALRLEARGLEPSFDGGVLCLDKDSRLRTEKEAGRRAFETAAALADADLLYHTVDSAIRGHLEAEILASLGAANRLRTALLAPAFPEAGRTTLDGVQHLHGQPIDTTGYAFDPIHPVRDARIRNRFPSLPDARVRHLDLLAVRRLGPGALTLGEAKLMIADAESQADLDRLVGSVADPREVLFCGSPGMARALAARFPGSSAAAPDLPAASLVVAAVGSLDAVSLAQRRYFAKHERAIEIVIDSVAAGRSPSTAARRAIAAVGPIPAETRSILVGTEPDDARRGDPKRIREALGLAIANLVHDLPVTGLILTGGDTAAAALRALAVTAIHLVDEVEPGIPLGWIDAPRPIRLITKAGGFGAPNVLAVSAALLRGDATGVTA